MTTLHVGDKAPNATVHDHKGQAVELQSLWTEQSTAQSTVLFFLRHLG